MGTVGEGTVIKDERYEVVGKTDAVIVTDAAPKMDEVGPEDEQLDNTSTNNVA